MSVFTAVVLVLMYPTLGALTWRLAWCFLPLGTCGGPAHCKTCRIATSTIWPISWAANAVLWLIWSFVFCLKYIAGEQ